MGIYQLAYGTGWKQFQLNDENVRMVVHPRTVDSQTTGVEAVREALATPIGSEPLKDKVRQGQKVVVVTSDLTRPMPSRQVVPLVLDELVAGGVAPEDITIVFAIGNHRPHTEAEMRYLVGDDIYEKVRCQDSNPQDCLRLGWTSSGTPVDIYRPVVEADVRVCLGNIEFHWFAGYSGGVKAIMPGVSTRAAIQANHRHLVSRDAVAGELDKNPVRCDIEEVADFLPVQFIVNVVLNEKKEIIKAFAGHHQLAHRQGCRFIDQMYKIDIGQKADLVIVSAGGYPKDLNLYQAQKALDNARQAVRPGGIIIWVCRAQEGLGEEVFAEWMQQADSPQAILQRIQTEFQLGGHKAAGLAAVLADVSLFLVSDLDDAHVRSLFMEPFAEVSGAVTEAMNRLGPDAGIILMPFGGSTLPVAASSGQQSGTEVTL